jgi:hypothetical protein
LQGISFVENCESKIKPADWNDDFARQSFRAPVEARFAF